MIETRTWKVPPIFRILQERGKVDREEMYQVFNMGIGMVAIVSPSDAATVAKIIRARPIGRIESGRGQTGLRFSSNAQ